ncbi:helix-turn-helix transcriptional regulator [Nocardioides sp. JQ2195]|uniref:winged helix-turn-helix transcriptional regulator n=1 Tax=Nocardioides sp. JQ2195 TaxID=2592334 RepID=UPI00143E5874|nr:helix-turn-helix domain-containing protein [Nocardioides sp. JQ2195]QIX25537.1 helix-turn-helix transcriptional regulator [Nocardioides sp. JQ2195]
MASSPSEARSIDGPSRTGTALGIICDHWSLLIIQRIFLGERRFQDIRERIGVSDSILADRLKRLTENGVLVKTPYNEGRVRYEYRLTRAGTATWRIYVAAYMWERKWLDRGEGPKPELRHLTCGELADPRVVCAKCDLPVTGGDLTPVNTSRTLGYVGSAPRRHRQSRTLQRVTNHGLFPDTMELLGDRWNTAIVATAVIGMKRFTDLERFLGIPPTVLSARLTRLVELEVLRPEVLVGGGRTVYRLTRKGAGFGMVLMQIVRWSDEHVGADAHKSLEITHDPCGRLLLPDFVCGHCSQRLKRSEVQFELVD